MDDNKSIKILVAEPNELFRHGLVEIIDSYKSFKVVGEVNSGETLVAKYFEIQPDIIIVNIIMPVISGFEAIEEIYLSDKEVRTLFISNYDDDFLLFYSYRCGGKGFLLSGEDPRKLFNSLKNIYQGNLSYPENIDCIINRYENLKEFTGYECKTIEYKLTNRELEIFLHYGQGMTTSQIAEKLFITKKTIEFHEYNIKEKLSLNSFSKLINVATKFRIFY